MRIAVAAFAIVLMAPALGLQSHDESNALAPSPPAGVPIRGKTDIALLVADKPPLKLQVDTLKLSPVRGVKFTARDVISLLPMAGRGAVIVVMRGVTVRLYGLRANGSMRYLGAGTGAAPADDNGEALWVTKRADRSRCTLRKIGLDGGQLERPRPFPCAATIQPGGASGLVVDWSALLDPITGTTIYKAPKDSRIVAATGDVLVIASSPRELTLHNVSTNTDQALPWPSMLSLIGESPVAPQGRLVALVFGDPAWKGGPQQALDLWLLDTASGELTHVPGMPVIVSLKRTAMAWTSNRRLVLLANSRGKDTIAIWKLGQRRLAVKSVHLPRRSGSNGLASLD